VCQITEYDLVLLPHVRISLDVQTCLCKLTPVKECVRSWFQYPWLPGCPGYV